MYENRNFRSQGDLDGDKIGAADDQEDFLKPTCRYFTDFCQPLVPWVNSLRREALLVYAGEWKTTLYEGCATK